jgi:hypothetical protein
VYRIDYADRRALDAREGFNPRRDSALNAYEPIKIVLLIQGDPLSLSAAAPFHAAGTER